MAAAMTRWILSVDPDRCGGSGVCAGLAPRHFTYTGRQSVPVAGPFDPDDQVLAAAECCPMEAIRIVDAASGQPLYPEG